MPKSPDCTILEASAGDVVAGALPPALLARLRAHAGGCGPCARTLVRQARLEALLQDLPAAPPVALEVPDLPRERQGRVLRLAPSVAAGLAAAAAVLAVVVLFPGREPEWQPSDADSASVRIDRIVDSHESPVVDERLLALTAGAEAVAMRRPAEAR